MASSSNDGPAEQHSLSPKAAAQEAQQQSDYNGIGAHLDPVSSAKVGDVPAQAPSDTQIGEEHAHGQLNLHGERYSIQRYESEQTGTDKLLTAVAQAERGLPRTAHQTKDDDESSTLQSRKAGNDDNATEESVMLGERSTGSQVHLADKPREPGAEKDEHGRAE